MNVEQMKTVLAEILLKTDLTPCLVGHRGVGKSAGIAKVQTLSDYQERSFSLAYGLLIKELKLLARAVYVH